MDLNNIQLKPNPFIKANPISRLLFLWVVPFLWKGSKKDLNLEDVYHSLPSDSSEKLGNFVEREWENELKSAKAKAEKGEHRKPKLWRVIRKLIWKRYILVGFGYSFDELCLRAAQPVILRYFIKTFSENEKDYPNLRRDQYLYAGALVLLTLIHAIVFQSMITITINIGMKVRLGISSLIYRKILRLRKVDSDNTNVGRLCNMLASDVSRFDQGFFLLHFFYICPLQIVIYCYLLWLELGWACLGGIGCIVCLLPFQVLVGRFSTYFRTRIARRTDKRGHFLNEILYGIRLIKMYAWEKPFCAVISKLRVYEIEYIRRGLYLRGAFVSIHYIAQKLIPFCVLILYVGLGNTLTAEKAFYTIAVFSILQTIMNRIPNGASQLGEMIASANRVELFLASSESCSAELLSDGNQETASSPAQNGNAFQQSKNSKEAKVEEPTEKGQEEQPSIIFDNFTGSWTEEQEILRDLNVNITGNKFVMVVGNVGAGKTTLLHAILSELPKTASSTGSCSVHGAVSYASQEAWIFPATLRQNIIFGLPMDEERYLSVIKFCCLEDDLRQFPDADLTLVGERGVSLSGGQKARVNLARAIYQNAEIYLLDDPLSAVDTKVSRLLMDDCITGDLLKDKLRILITHQLQYLPAADHIIVLNKKGSIWFQGTYDELQKSEFDFTSLISDKYLVNGTDIDELLQENEKNVQAENDRAKLPNDESENGIKAETRNLLTGVPVYRFKDEEKRIGSIGIGTYLNYFKSGNSYLTMIFILLTFISCQLLFNMLDYWLGLWTNSVTQKAPPSNSTNLSSSEVDVNLTSIWSDFAEKEGISEGAFFAYVYSGMIGIFVILTIFRSIFFFRYCMKISINLHDSMFGSLVRAPTKFFDDNPSGRIMNRFTKDLNNIDEALPVSFYDFIQIFLALLGMLTINIIANYFIAVPAVLLLIGLATLRRFYLATTRDLKRIEALTKSPMFTHVTMTAQGLTTIRALRASKRVLDQFEAIQDTHTSTFFMSFTTSRWFALWLELMSCMFMATVCFGFLILPLSAKSGSVGMAISAIMSLAGSLQWGIRQSAETENFMTSVERAFEYCNLKSEAPLEYNDDAQVKQQNWPKEGRIYFHSVSLSYDENEDGSSSDNKVLKEITFSTNSKEKIGIVGRTGAGKSSLITALFRMTELSDGVISIDDIPIQDLGLHTLRSRISIIPQDPVLFSGSMRYNLDPFEEYPDDQLWKALSDVELKNAVPSLDYKVDDGGSNFSTGQRQLVCLARAILRRNKILVLDEPTANVDPVTDEMVQKTIRSKFSDCTILIIAHRLQSVLDNDRILVLDAGRVLEFDKPEVLAANPNGVFSAMLKQSNAASSVHQQT